MGTKVRNGHLCAHHIHFVGIGGIGLSAIARVLASWGYKISGSDLQGTDITRELGALGIKTFVGHAPEQVRGADLVVVSSAIPEANVEIQAAREMGIPVIKRHALLGQMMRGSYGIAVAGTHGKTTTTAMIAVLLERLGLCPTFIVGGVVAELGTNAQAGTGPHFVLEADEYDRTFHGLRPTVAVVTNIEMDHPDCYRDVDDMRDAYGVFLDLVSPAGAIVACADSPELGRLLRDRGQNGPGLLTYGLVEDSALAIKDVRANEKGGVDWRVMAQGQLWGEFSLQVPGLHNALNATAALAVVDTLGHDRLRAAQALAQFQGVLRRFQVKGESGRILVVDDYAHHPTEIRATLAASRLRYPRRRVWAVWQPHTFSRTEALFEEFRECFGDADQVIVMDVYAARAREKATVHAQDLARAIRHHAVQHIGDADAVVDYLAASLAPGDVLLTLGAGDGYLVGERVLQMLRRRAE